MNKKAFLLGEETLKIIIAIIAISFLIYLLFSLYMVSRTSKDIEFAESSLNYLIKEINSLKEGEIRDVGIYNPEGWGIASFDGGIEKTPDFCLNRGWDKCICICGPLGGSVKTAKMACPTIDKKGIVCHENDFIIEGTATIYDPPLILTIDYENKIITQKEK